MIRSIYRPKDGPCQWNLTLSQIAAAHQENAGLLWVSLERPSPEELRAVLQDIFHFHPLAIEDCQSVGYQPPKVDDFGQYLFMILHACHSDDSFQRLETMELNCFLGHHYLVTSYMAPAMLPLQTVWKRLERNERLLDRGADFLCHAILDELVDEYLPLLDAMNEEIEILEDQVLRHPQPETLHCILALKHSILTLRRVISPQREVITRLSRGEFPQISSHNRIYFRDIYDHLVRIQDLSESMRDVITGALDVYLSTTSNRLNEVMKALTIVSTVFLPLSFVAGVYGMNFHYMPELSWRYGYLMVWIIFISIFLTMLWWFRRRSWL